MEKLFVGVKINYNETEYLTNDHDDLYIERIIVRKVDNFCYLGSLLEQNRSLDKEIKIRVSSGTKTISL